MSEVAHRCRLEQSRRTPVSFINSTLADSIIIYFPSARCCVQRARPFPLCPFSALYRFGECAPLQRERTVAIYRDVSIWNYTISDGLLNDGCFQDELLADHDLTALLTFSVMW